LAHREVGVDDAFFARLVGTDGATFSGWRSLDGALPHSGEETLRSLWRTVLHLLSFLGFDGSRTRDLFLRAMPASAGAESPLTIPRW
jgi:hypothetical protein